MTQTHSIADHWAVGDVFARILAAMKASAISPETATVEDLAPVDHFHARGFAARRELADVNPGAKRGSAPGRGVILMVAQAENSASHVI